MSNRQLVGVVHAAEQVSTSTTMKKKMMVLRMMMMMILIILMMMTMRFLFRTWSSNCFSSWEIQLARWPSIGSLLRWTVNMMITTILWWQWQCWSIWEKTTENKISIKMCQLLSQLSISIFLQEGRAKLLWPWHQNSSRHLAKIYCMSIISKS